MIRRGYSTECRDFELLKAHSIENQVLKGSERPDQI